MYRNIKLKPASTQTNIKMQGGYPLELKPGQLKNFQLNTHNILRINSFVWANTPVRPGAVFSTTQGARLVLSVHHQGVIYILSNRMSQDHNKIYIQNSKGFIGDVTSFVFEEVGRRGQTVKKLAELEINILIGIYSVMSWGAFTTIIGMDVFQFVAQNGTNFPRWQKVSEAIIDTRSDLKKYAPTLYEKVLYSILLIAWEGIGENAGSGLSSLSETASNDTKIAGRGVGAIIGKFGVQIAERKLTILSAVWILLFTRVTTLLSATPGAINTALSGISNTKNEDLSLRLVEIVRGSGVTLSKEDANKIIEEVSTHPKELVGSITKLVNAFRKV